MDKNSITLLAINLNQQDIMLTRRESSFLSLCLVTDLSSSVEPAM